MGSIQKAKLLSCLVLLACFGAIWLFTPSGRAQLPDKTVTPNTANEGINKSFEQQVGAGRGSVNTPGSSLFIINRDPFRAVRPPDHHAGDPVTFARQLARRTGVADLYAAA